jgi:hypothetical protein
MLCLCVTKSGREPGTRRTTHYDGEPQRDLVVELFCDSAVFRGMYGGGESAFRSPC